MVTLVKHSPQVFRPNILVWRPDQLKAYFQEQKSLLFPAKKSLYFQLTILSQEWKSNTPVDVIKVTRVFNEFLRPKTCAIYSSHNEPFEIEVLSDGFKLFTIQHPFHINLT